MSNLRELRQAWDIDSVPPVVNTNTYRLLTALSKHLNQLDERIQSVEDAQHIDTATGEHLEKLGSLADVRRRRGETDASYRTRIKARFTTGLTGTTHAETVEFLANLLNISVDNVAVTKVAGPVADITLPIQAIQESPLNAADVQDLADDAVPAGHTTQIVESGTFELKTDGDTDDADKGLTSDGSSQGGTLSGDIV